VLILLVFTYDTKIIDAPLAGSRFSGFPSSGDEFALNVKAALLSPIQESWKLLSLEGWNLDTNAILK
jgi:hypothetical protein